MEHTLLTLCDLPLGTNGRIISLFSHGAQRRRMLDLGLIPGTRVCALQKSPFGDPTAYFVRGAVIALREEDAQKITVSAGI